MVSTCRHCRDEISNDIGKCDFTIEHVSDGQEWPVRMQWFHTYYSDVWCRNSLGTKAEPDNRVNTKEIR